MTSTSLITKGKICRTSTRDTRIVKIKLNLKVNKNIKLTLRKGSL